MYNTEGVKGCDTCLSEDSKNEDFPCSECDVVTLDKWSPKVNSEEDMLL